MTKSLKVQRTNPSNLSKHYSKTFIFYCHFTAVIEVNRRFKFNKMKKKKKGNNVNIKVKNDHHPSL